MTDLNPDRHRVISDPWRHMGQPYYMWAWNSYSTKPENRFFQISPKLADEWAHAEYINLLPGAVFTIQGVN